MEVDRDSGQTIAHHPQWPGVSQGPPHGARPVPVPPGLHPPQPPAPSTSRQNGGGPGPAAPDTPGALSPATNYPPGGATLSYREGDRGEGGSWTGQGPGRVMEQQGPVCTLPMPEFWCSIAYFELDTQVLYDHL